MLFDAARKIRRNDYEIEEIGEKMYRINEYNVANCYLIVGETKALLIDTGAGVGDLVSKILPLTEGKPLEVALTSALPCTAGGRHQFDQVYLSEKDIPLLEQCGLKERKRYVWGLRLIHHLKVIKRKECRWTTGTDPKVIAVNDGDTLNIGGRTIRAIRSKGVTRGALIYLAVEDGVLFVGDTFNPCMSLKRKRATTTEELKTSLQCILRGSGYDTIRATHFAAPVPRERIQDAVDCIENIVRHSNGLPLIHISSYKDFTVLNWGHKRRMRMPSVSAARNNMTDL